MGGGDLIGVDVAFDVLVILSGGAVVFIGVEVGTIVEVGSGVNVGVITSKRSIT